jgi:7-cyano-7-deazaguanine synthase in queuosine biosynthesis
MININGLNIATDIDSIAVTVSGGVDSTLLLYLTAKYFNEENINIDLHLITGYRHPDQLSTATNVINYIKDKFPNINWQEHHAYDNTWDQSKYEFRGQADKDNRAPFLRLYDIRHILHGRVLTTLTKSELNYCEEFYPREVAKIRVREKTFKYTKNYTANNGHTYITHFPITFNTKKEIIDMYTTFNIVDLLPKTISCYGQSKIPCKVCPACVEKYRLLDYY